VRRRDGSKVEVALDIGHISIGKKTTPICELELELLSGQPTALFAVAQTIAHSMSVMPLAISKSARGYALAQNALELPRRAQPPQLSRDLTLKEAAPCVLKEMFCQFTTNLVTLRTSDDLEVVHQARVGWRRFKSALRLFKPILNPDTRPSLQPLQGLLSLLSELRELDVARTDTLPSLQHAFTAGNTRRAKDWQAMTQVLGQATTGKRQALRHALQEPILGSALLDITQWLESPAVVNAPGREVVEQRPALTRWARRRLVRLHGQLKLALQAPSSVESLHQTRIAAKRQRYAIEALRPLLHRRRAKRWYRQALTLQNDLGAERDLVRAGELLGQLKVDRSVVEFLRGVAAGKS
jgi:inorganic triphosphatase YgiF